MNWNALSRVDRRTALQLAAAAGLPAWLADELRAADPPAAPAEKPKIALVGCGGMGRADATNASRFGTVVAVCDVDATRAAAAAKQFNGATAYGDFRKLLEKEKGVSVVINGTPDHWHTLVNIAAVRAGKDVYGEKPLTLTVDEGKRLVAEVRKHNRIFQTGSQQRSDPKFRLAVEAVRNGRLGKLQTVTVTLPAGLNAGPFPTAPVPAGLDWDMWQGQAPAREYVPQRCHQMFRYWLEYSGGTLTDWGAHHTDIALWAIDQPGPTSVQGKATVKPVPDGYTTPAQYEVELRYANGVVQRVVSTTASTIFGERAKDAKPDRSGHGIRFEGTDGWLWVTRGEIKASRPEILSDTFADTETRLPAVNDHMGNFFDCVRSRKAPVAEAAIGHRSVTACHLGVIAVRLGRPLAWNPQAEEFVNDKEANGFLAREQRGPWTYDKV